MSGSGSIGLRGAAKDITFSAEARKISRPDHRGTFPFQKDRWDRSLFLPQRSDQIIRSGEAWDTCFSKTDTASPLDYADQHRVSDTSPWIEIGKRIYTDLGATFWAPLSCLHLNLHFTQSDAFLHAGNSTWSQALHAWTHHEITFSRSGFSKEKLAVFSLVVPKEQ